MAYHLHTRWRNWPTSRHHLRHCDRLPGVQAYVAAQCRLCASKPLTHLVEDPKSTPFRLNLAATILLPSIVPFTLLVIGPTNNKLIAKKDEFAAAHAKGKAIKANTVDGETVHELMDKWATLNMARALLVAAGALCAVIAAVNKKEVAKLGNMSMASRLGW